MQAFQHIVSRGIYKPRKEYVISGHTDSFHLKLVKQFTYFVNQEQKTVLS